MWYCVSCFNYEEKKYKLQQNTFTLSKNKDHTFNLFHYYDYSQSGLKMSGSWQFFRILKEDILDQIKKNTLTITVDDYLHEDTTLTALFTFCWSANATIFIICELPKPLSLPTNDQPSSDNGSACLNKVRFSSDDDDDGL